MGNSKERVLIVEDEHINRKILSNILASDYDVAEAENGMKALEFLDSDHSSINAILLDIIMPVMDGFQFLTALKDKSYCDIPVIVMTGETGSAYEERALNAGACDFVAKPYRPSIILSRLKNAIARSQVKYMQQIRHLAEHDPLTDLYNRAHFFDSTSKMLSEHRTSSFLMVRFDIDRFQVLNSIWGEKASNKFLIFVAQLLREVTKDIEICTYGRMETASFCFCISCDKKKLKEIVDFLIEKMANYDMNYLIEPSLGVYEVTDCAMPVETMYLCASIAVNRVREKYKDYVCFYQPSMRENLIKEQYIVDEMETALDQEQFEIYLQPKYNLQTNEPYGAEALVRWMHPVKGAIMPGVFIPIFEKNGFIGKLDVYVWEHVCRLLRQWLDKGINPAPVSVNMSRADLYNPTPIDTINALIKKYNISPDLLNLELTESTYMDNPQLMSDKIQKLRSLGFSIMLDDFGSAYSSLNMLKDIHVDYIKIDMKFLKDKGDDTRSERVLASVVRMAFL